MQKDILEKMEQNKSLELNIKKIINENTNKFENTEEILFINSHNMTLPTVLNNVTCIELKDFDLSFDKYNITNNNNNLTFIVDIVDKVDTSDKVDKADKDNDVKVNNSDNESDTANAIDSEQNSLIEMEYDTETKKLSLTLLMGNYTIDTLCSILNQHLSKYNIVISYNKNTNIVTFKNVKNSRSKFDMIINDNSLLSNLGFNTNNTYTNKMKYTGSRTYNFKQDKCMNIYFTNINQSKPLYQYIMNQANAPKKIVLTPVVSDLDKLCVKFVDSKGKEFKFDPNNGLEFSINVVVKYISNNQNSIKHELNDISSDDIYTLVKQQNQIHDV